MTDRPYNGPQRRSYFRVKYPPEYAPRFMVYGYAYFILDICEHGVRISNPLSHRMPEDIFPAYIQFGEDDEKLKVMARLIRIEPKSVAIYLIQGIPYKQLVAEQIKVKNLDKGKA
jgi:hypothetical protein